MVIVSVFLSLLKDYALVSRLRFAEVIIKDSLLHFKNLKKEYLS